MIYVVKPNGDVLGAINGLKEESCNLKRILTDIWEISFEVTKYINIDGNFELSDYYDSISEKMQIRLETDLIDTMFVIDSEPVISNNGIQETKTVTAHTTECELQNKFLRLFYINNGTPTSKEYLATNNINSYTQLPNEYISFVNFDNHELSLLHLALEGTEWTVDENLKETESVMCAKKFAFGIDEQDIYSFLTNQIAKTAQIVFFFNGKNRVISFKSYENLGEDTGIFIGLRNLANQIDIESTSETGLITKYKPTCSENLGVEYVNFGDPYIYNMDYFANSHNEYGDYKYVTKSFHDEYVAWINKRDSNRQSYINLTKEYNANLIKISELKNRLPNDGCSIDYKTYKADELYFSLNAYENAIATLITLYKEDYPEKYTNPNVALDEIHLKSTMYWNDYYSYRYQIIPSVKEAMKIWYQTDNYGNLSVGNDGKYILCENGNPSYASNVDIVKPIDSYKYEFALYGLDELQSKKKAWLECVNLLYKDGFVLSGTKENPTQYNTPDDAGWNRLTASQKLQFTNISAFKENLNNYLDYMSIETRNNSITGTNCKGIIRQCDDAIMQIQSEINSLQAKNDAIQNNRNTMSSAVLPENNFNSDNLKIFRLLLHEENYINENIVTTSLDDIISSIDVAEELYQDAKEKLSIVSQPQYSFKVSIDNLFSLEEFSSYKDSFDIGNFIKLLPDFSSDDFVKLRVILIESNPLINTNDITVEFSSMTKSLSDINDIAFLFEGENSASSISNTGSSNSGGTYGNNDAEIQIANNMLNALLKTETFGTQVSDIILDSIRANTGNFGKLIAHSGIFDTLESGEVKINGACLTNIIKSLNYISGTEGSMFNLNDGSIDFAGGSFTYDKNRGLIIKGAKGKTSIDGASVNTGAIVSNNYNGTSNNPYGNTKGSIIDLVNGLFNFGGGNLKFLNNMLYVNGNIVANTLTANNSGTIAGWYFDHTGFYKVDENGNKQIVIGNEGISAGETFSLSEDGTCSLTNVKSIGCGNTFNSDKNGTIIKSKNEYDIYSSYLEINNSIEITTDFSITIENVNIGDNFDLKTGIAYTYGTNDGGNKVGNVIITVYGQVEGEHFFSYNFEPEYTLTAPLGCDYRLSYNQNEHTLTLVLPYEYISMGHPAYSDTSKYTLLYYIIGAVTSIENDNQIRKCEYNGYVHNGNISYHGFGIKFDTLKNNVSGDLFKLCPNKLYLYKNFDIKYYDDLEETDLIVQINKKRLFHKGLSTSSSGTSLVSLNGDFVLKSSSSQRYKHDINLLGDKSISLDPHKLYDIDVVTFKYNDDYLQPSDQRYDTDIPGFIAEDVYEKYPIACNLDSHGRPEMWEINIMFPAALKLIQEQHEEIEKLKKRIEVLEQKI